MKPVRIAYVINSVEGGGAALPVPAVTKVLRDCGASVKVFVLTPRDRRALPSIEAAGLTPSIREGGEKDQAITKVIINLAKSLGLEVLAEGVETAPQLAFLSQRMCDDVQGYYYYKPMPAAEIEKLLRSSAWNKFA